MRSGEGQFARPVVTAAAANAALLDGPNNSEKCPDGEPFISRLGVSEVHSMFVKRVR